MESCARLIAGQLSDYAIEVHSLNAIKALDLPFYDLVIVGGSTVGADIWENAADNNLWFDFFARLDSARLDEKPVAIFGLGDQVLYPGHFVDGMRVIKNEFDRIGATLVGRWPTDGYDFTDSESLEEDKFIGLALDEDQQPELTEKRIHDWAAQIIKEAGL